MKLKDLESSRTEPRYYIRKPSFWDGMSSLHDLYNVRPYHIDQSFRDDMYSMKSDFDLVGQDLKTAFSKLNI